MCFFLPQPEGPLDNNKMTQNNTKIEQNNHTLRLLLLLLLLLLHENKYACY